MDFDKKISEIVKAVSINYDEAFIDDNTKLAEEMGIDSIGMMKLIIALESEFDLDFSDCYDSFDEIFLTYGSLKNFLYKYLK